MICGETQSYWWPPQTVTSSSIETPVTSSAEPSQSIGFFSCFTRQVQHGAEHEERGDAQRDVDVEDPAPRQVLGEQAAEQRADDADEMPNTAPNRPGVAAALARRDRGRR